MRVRPQFEGRQEGRELDGGTLIHWPWQPEPIDRAKPRHLVGAGYGLAGPPPWTAVIIGK